ncbi:MAG: DEAD/DEAH box helicase, partial [Candidatus Dormibacteraeota bacterium]|nr:DEAD/DEAH box helicase [Candidatus Dormibacteraeota bacterium]
MGSSLDLFAPATRDWFRSSFDEPTQVQERGWQEVAAGKHVLMAAPTGSGKTLAAFLWCLDRLSSEPVPVEAERCRVLYVSPLKALAHDVDRNLRSPLVGLRHQIEAAGGQPPDISVAIRTGDTPADVRRSMERHPPDILITTPESLFLLLTSNARRILASVRWLIVDEIHSVAATKRGSHLALSLERLCELTKMEPQRIGLSATQRPLEEVAHFLGGTEREVAIVDAGRLKTMEVRVEVPVDDMARMAVEDESGQIANSIWPAIYPRVLQMIREHRSTIVFVNSRRLAERIAARVNELAGEELVRAHHGSIAREQRLLIEDELKAGIVKGLIATSTLELGIDMGAVDLVMQVEAPPSVAAGIQRVGRAGHSVGEISKGIVIPKFRGDLLVSAAVVEGMLEG